MKLTPRYLCVVNAKRPTAADRCGPIDLPIRQNYGLDYACDELQYDTIFGKIPEVVILLLGLLRRQRIISN